MKLRNKETGGLANMLDEQDFIRVYTDAGWADYYSLASLNAEWEDYGLKDPLIKDEKVRRAVRAWAEANDIEEAGIQNNYCLASKEDEDVTIIFASPIFKDIDDTDFYTIAELCGEEEE